MQQFLINTYFYLSIYFKNIFSIVKKKKLVSNLTLSLEYLHWKPIESHRTRFVRVYFSFCNPPTLFTDACTTKSKKQVSFRIYAGIFRPAAYIRKGKGTFVFPFARYWKNNCITAAYLTFYFPRWIRFLGPSLPEIYGALWNHDLNRVTQCRGSIIIIIIRYCVWNGRFHKCVKLFRI